TAWHFFVHWTGGDFGAPAYGYLEPYDWLSGILGLTFLGLLYNHWRKNNCEVHGCWRIGRHTTAAGPKDCQPHNPEGRVTAQTVRERHHLYLGQRPGRG